MANKIGSAQIMSSTSRKETEKNKLIQEKCQTLLVQMLRDEDNKYCVDCDAKGPRWASWNLGIFLCIRCAGIHRNLGVHISRVKSVNLDTWTPEQVISLQQMGNSRARAVYEAQLPDGFRRPQTDTALESFIRAKYEHKKYLAREWVPPSPPKVDWGKEIDEELERQKRKKKAAQANSALGIGVMSGGGGGDKKSIGGSAAAKSAPLPAPLPKPKPGQSGSSPKTQRITAAAAAAQSSGEGGLSNDLLGLSSPTKPTALPTVGASAAQDLHADSFSGFLSATPTNAQHTHSAKTEGNPNSLLAKEEEDFFNQGSLGSGLEKDKSGKLTKDSILALYGNAPANSPHVAHNPHNPQQMQFGGQPPMFGAGAPQGNFTGMAPGFMGAQHPQQPHPQFMTPPNSTSMYNAPVMTAPVAFTSAAPGMAQFPMQGGAPAAAAGGGMMMPPAGGIMATGQHFPHLNLMQTNQQQQQQNLLLGGGIGGMQSQQQQPQLMGGMVAGGGGFHQGMMFGGGGSAGFQAPPTAATATANLNQQFGNLNIGNVWQ